MYTFFFGGDYLFLMKNILSWFFPSTFVLNNLYRTLSGLQYAISLCCSYFTALFIVRILHHAKLSIQYNLTINTKL